MHDKTKRQISKKLLYLFTNSIKISPEAYISVHSNRDYYINEGTQFDVPYVFLRKVCIFYYVEYSMKYNLKETFISRCHGLRFAFIENFSNRKLLNILKIT